MLANLFALIKTEAASRFSNDPSVPTQHQDGMLNEASSSIIDVLKDQLATGKLKDVLELFQHSDISNHPIVSRMLTKFTSRLQNNYAIAEPEAKNIASDLIHPVMEKLVKKTNDPEDNSFDLPDMISQFGGNEVNLGGIISKFTAQ
ncbi:MAG: hypothetical protein ACOH2A_15750 [Sphingobacteriaceae bacterium]